MTKLNPPNQGFPDFIEFPNGEGYTPCSREYAEKTAAKDAIFNCADIGPGNTLDDLSPEDYEAYCRLDNELLSMQASGQHLGKSVRY